MKKVLIICISIIAAALIVCTVYTYLNKAVTDKNDLLSYLENKKIVRNGYSFSLKIQKDIDNKRLILFTFNQKGSYNKQLGIAAFQRLNNGEYKYEKFSGSGLNTNVCPISTVNANGNIQSYTIFYGIATEGTNKFKITYDSIKSIEEFEPGKYFIRYYLLKADNKGVKIVPVG